MLKAEFWCLSRAWPAARMEARRSHTRRRSAVSTASSAMKFNAFAIAVQGLIDGTRGELAGFDKWRIMATRMAG